jgi:hypothetical protein
MTNLWGYILYGAFIILCIMIAGEFIFPSE